MLELRQNFSGTKNLSNTAESFKFKYDEPIIKIIKWYKFVAKLYYITLVIKMGNKNAKIEC